MSPTSIEQLARRAGEALREHADRVDARKPGVEDVRRRDRIRRASAAGAAVAVLIVGLVIFVQVRPSSAPVIGDDGPPASEHEPSDMDTPEAITSRILVAEGTYEDSDRTWTLHAWLTSDEGVCLELGGTACGRAADEDRPLGFVGASGQSGPEESGCQYGTVNDEVATVEIDFFGGRTITLEPVDGGPLPTNFFATCWDGHRQQLTVRALDEHGQVLSTGGTQHEPGTADAEPVQPDHPWFGPDGTMAQPITDDVIKVLRGPDHCDWQQALLLHVGWPIGTEKDGGDFRQYVRDPNNVLPDEPKQTDYLPDVQLPDTAAYTGYRTDTAELWIAPDTSDDRIYVVAPNHVEQWPRADPPILCA